MTSVSPTSTRPLPNLRIFRSEVGEVGRLSTVPGFLRAWITALTVVLWSPRALKSLCDRLMVSLGRGVMCCCLRSFSLLHFIFFSRCDRDQVWIVKLNSACCIYSVIFCLKVCSAKSFLHSPVSKVQHESQVYPFVSCFIFVIFGFYSDSQTPKTYIRFRKGPTLNKYNLYLHFIYIF